MMMMQTCGSSSLSDAQEALYINRHPPFPFPFLGVSPGRLCPSGFPLLDPLAGVAVSALIAKMGVSIGWDSMHELADRGLEGSILKEIRASAETVDGVIVCQSLRGRRMGPFVSIDMLIEVNPWTSVSIAHNIRSMVAHRVRSDHDQVILWVALSPLPHSLLLRLCVISICWLGGRVEGWMGGHWDLSPSTGDLIAFRIDRSRRCL